MIPKVIHYCWFGDNPKTELILKCIKSWEKYAPDFEIIEWNERNFNINEYAYAREAYSLKKWAFVSDVARFHILQSNGGIYLDTDVELIKPINELLDNEMFMAYDQRGRIAPGLIMGSVAGHYMLKKILEYYQAHHFKMANGLPNTTTVVTIVSSILEENSIDLNGLNFSNNHMRLYDMTYFDPYNFETKKISLKENTISIHHYEASWKSAKDIVIYKCGVALRKLIGGKLYSKIAKIKHQIVG